MISQGPTRDSSPPCVLLQAASLLAEDLRDRAVETFEGSVKWPTAVAFELATSLRPSDSPVADGFWDLYSGNPGIAIFLAAYSRVSGDRAYRDLCLRALEPVRNEILRSQRAASAPGSSAPLGIGALVGTTSWIYALLTAGKLLHDSQLASEAHTLSAMITPERVFADRHCDLVFGSAGALLVLLALDHIDPAPNPGGLTPMDLAKLCAHSLITMDFKSEAPSGDTTLQRSHFGLSHGLAGVGLALSRLYGRTQDPEIGCAVRRILTLLLPFASDATRFSPQGGSPPGSGASWCHGTSGLSVAFTAMLASGVDEGSASGLRGALRQAVEWTRRAPFSPQDHLCCGNMGRAAALAYVSQETEDPPLFEAACDLATFVLRVAKTRQGFTLDYDQPDASLFRGFAGIAYTLLALAEPRGLPRIIALE